MALWNSIRYGISFLALMLLAACQTGAQPPTPTGLDTLSTTAELEQEWAERGELVRVTLTGGNTKVVAVTVAGVAAEVGIRSGSEFDFVVPDVASGEQRVEIALEKQTLLTSIGVLGDDIVPGELVLVVEPGTTVLELTELLSPLQFLVLEGPRPLGTAAGPCSGELVRIQVQDVSVGEALTLVEDQGGTTVWHADPQTGYSSGTVDHLGAVGATEAHLRGLGGEGTVIAVLDTGVSAHAELGTRLLTSQGYDFVDEGTLPLDEFGQVGHGTPVAVLAAGSSSGVAPQARILPERVCDSTGTCYTNDITLGLCHAFAASERELGGLDRLVLNLSFGGETPIAAIRAILEYGTANGTLAAAAGGNQGEAGSPPHYPAAYDLAGVLGVAALEADLVNELTTDWKPAAFSTRGSYLDIAAPGVDLTSGTPSGGYHSGYQGTSFATALAAGGLALWREAEPAMSPADVEAGLEAAARPLSYSETAVGAGMLDLSDAPN